MLRKKRFAPAALKEAAPTLIYWAILLASVIGALVLRKIGSAELSHFVLAIVCLMFVASFWWLIFGIKIELKKQRRAGKEPVLDMPKEERR
jgi:ABC-type thiamin/hydroxymethylpyrimidine transport system permease subunit